MSRKLVVNITQLTDAHRAAIAGAAKVNSFEAVFCGAADEALRAAADAEVIFGADLALPGAARGLKWLCVPSAGAEAYLRPGVFASADAVLTNSSGAYGVTIAEHIIMVTLELMRRQRQYTDLVNRREWRRDLPVRSICGCRATLLGTGDIGQTAAMRLRGFGPKSVVGVNRGGKNPGGLFDRVVPLAGLDAVLPETDLLILSLPDTPETRGLLDARRLALLPEDAFIVNVGRGSAIDQRALEAALRAGRLAGAALDVFEREPLPADDAIWACPRLLITPHVAGNMTLAYTVDRIVALFLENFERYCAGQPLLRVVNGGKGY